MAGWLLNFGRPSELAAEGEEVGEGTVVSGEDLGPAGVISGVAIGVGAGVPAGVSDAAGAGVTVGEVTFGGGVGELADGPPAGSAGFCPHPMIRKLATAMGTIKRVFMPLDTDA